MSGPAFEAAGLVAAFVAMVTLRPTRCGRCGHVSCFHRYRRGWKRIGDTWHECRDRDACDRRRNR